MSKNINSGSEIKDRAASNIKKNKNEEIMHGSDDDDDHNDEQLDSLDSSDDDTISCENDSSTDHAEQDEFIKNSEPKTELEIAQGELIKRQDLQITKLRNEVKKLKTFISKRKQTYKRKRKDNQAPTRALSAYNIFVQDRFSKLASDNEAALLSSDTSAQLKRVPPASLVASSGEEWKNLPEDEKTKYRAMAEIDKKRYKKEIEGYLPPEKEGENKKRNKTGYNMFFSAYVLQLKHSSAGVPPERGSTARLVGNAWKELNHEEKQYYEREAERRNEAIANNEPIEEALEAAKLPKVSKSSKKANTPAGSEATPAPTAILQHPIGWPPERTGHFHPPYHPTGQYHPNHPHYVYPPHPVTGYYHGPPPPQNFPPQQQQHQQQLQQQQQQPGPHWTNL
mmetsp:Transcript_25201/g.36102  ORF Transcript_25201/g.36102 Transcript_25201/m.36102 type:complete len:395 (+) Transcript_25201:34-1218(+)